jgi:hypothetical protein
MFLSSEICKGSAERNVPVDGAKPKDHHVNSRRLSSDNYT